MKKYKFWNIIFTSFCPHIFSFLQFLFLYLLESSHSNKNWLLCLSFCSLYFLPCHLWGLSLDGTRLVCLCVLCLWQDKPLQNAVTRTGQSFSFLPVICKSQHLYRELHVPWSCHELPKDLGIWTLPVSFTPLSLLQNLFVRNLTDCLSPGKQNYGNNCSYCISNHKILHSVHSISHSFWCL